MEVAEVLRELEALSNARLKKIYLGNGVREPLFGVATTKMKPLQRRIGRDYELAQKLYETGNYDAMYFAGMIADPARMTEADFERWMDGAYCYMIAEWIVSVSLAETEFAQAVSDRWIASGEELRMSAGWNCYCWLLGNRKDEAFDREKLSAMLKVAGAQVHGQAPRVKAAMNAFIAAVGVHYLPLYTDAVQVAEAVGVVEEVDGKRVTTLPPAREAIQAAADRGKLGWKRKGVRC